MMSTSQVVEYLGCSGFELYILSSSCENSGCLPTGTPSTCSCVMETADRIMLIDQYCIPSLKRQVRNSMKNWIEQEMGLTCCSWHQLAHCFHALWYVEFVPLLHPAARSFEASMVGMHILSDCPKCICPYYIRVRPPTDKLLQWAV